MRHVLEADDPRLASYRAAAEKIGETPEQFAAWIDRMFEKYAELEGRETAAKAREAAVLARENAVSERESALAARLAQLQRL